MDIEKIDLLNSIRLLSSEPIMNELIEVILFGAERSSMDLGKRQPISKNGKIICPRNFFEDSSAKGELMIRVCSYLQDFKIIHDPTRTSSFRVSARNDQLFHSSCNFWRALIKVVIMEKLCYE